MQKRFVAADTRDYLRPRTPVGIVRSKSSGFTLVELLVVIAIIGILVALLLPAVQSAREAARRSQCINNFKQVGVGLQNYYSARGHFPSGIENYTVGEPCSMPKTQTPWSLSGTTGWSWGAYILPYMEENAVYSQINFKYPAQMHTPLQNFKAAANKVPSFLCPSDQKGFELVACCSGMSNGGSPAEDIAKTNMAGVADSRDWTCDAGKSWGRTDADGVMYQVSLTPIKKITDGTSQTLMVGEVVGGLKTNNFGFYWVTWNVLHTANGINLASRIEPLRWNSVDEGSFASFHPGGCHFLYCDGHTGFLTEDIDKATLASLTTRAGEDVISTEY